MDDQTFDAAGRGGRPRATALTGATILVVLAVGAAIVATLAQRGQVGTSSASHSVPSAAPGSVAPTVAVAVEATTRTLTFERQGVSLVVPGTWEIGEAISGPVAHVTDGMSDSSMVIYHGAALEAIACDPTCSTISLPQYLPVDYERTLDDLQTALTDRTGVRSWVPVDRNTVRLRDPRRLDVPALDGTAIRRSYLIGQYANGLVLAVAAVPAGASGDELLTRLFEGIRPFPSKIFKIGTPVTFEGMALGFIVDVPDLWPVDDRHAATGARTFGDGRMSISVPDGQGILEACDPLCRNVVADDLRELERDIFRPDRPGITLGDTTLSGVAARYQLDRSTVSPSYRVIAIVGGEPVHLWFDRSDPGVDDSTIDAIVASFRYLRPTANQIVDGVLLGPGFKVPLPVGWGTRHRYSPTVTVSVGDDAGSLWVCRWTNWDTPRVPCAIEQGSTLDELMRQTAVEVWGDRTEVLLDGERAILVDGISAYEPMARGGQFLAYVFAFHDGRPYVIRLWNPESTGLHVQEILDTFRFTD